MSVPNTIAPSILFPDGTILYAANISSVQAVGAVVNVGLGGIITAYSYTTTDPSIALQFVAVINRLKNGQIVTQVSPPNPTALIPIMTNYTAPSGTASAGTEITGHEAWRPYGNGASWIASSTALPQEIQYQFGSGLAITAYSVYCDTLNEFATGWFLQGSNDGATWTTLDTQNNYAWPTNQVAFIQINNSTSYSYYQLTITGMNIVIPAYVSQFQLFN